MSACRRVRCAARCRVPRPALGSATHGQSAARAPLLSTLLSTHSLAPSLPVIPVHPSPLERDARAPRLSTPHLPLHLSLPPSIPARRASIVPISSLSSPSYPFDPTDSYTYVPYILSKYDKYDTLPVNHLNQINSQPVGPRK
ncbi:hypothetical protein B0H14DRAFT_3466916 [Mycena olivaceomarginata]|nr:hypothetical protein B0H14DRAFT_3466916 [Mycena olivaceomarginata]